MRAGRDTSSSARGAQVQLPDAADFNTAETRRQSARESSQAACGGDRLVRNARALAVWSFTASPGEFGAQFLVRRRWINIATWRAPCGSSYRSRSSRTPGGRQDEPGSQRRKKDQGRGRKGSKCEKAERRGEETTTGGHRASRASTA